MSRNPNEAVDTDMDWYTREIGQRQETRRTQRVGIWLTPQEKTRLEERAEALGVPTARLARLAVESRGLLE